MNHVAKNYTIGDLFLAEPYLHFVQRLPLLTFGDMMGSVELDLMMDVFDVNDRIAKMVIRKVWILT